MEKADQNPGNARPWENAARRWREGNPASDRPQVPDVPLRLVIRDSDERSFEKQREILDVDAIQRDVAEEVERDMRALRESM